MKRSVVALTEEWPSQPDAGDIVARTPAGPFPKLSTVCAALDRKESEDRYEGRYKYDLATAGRFASTVEEGVIACEVVTGSVACTPKIATHSYSARMDTSMPDWPLQTDVLSACTASFANGTITIAPMPKPDSEDETWTGEAAAGCSGTRTVRY